MAVTREEIIEALKEMSLLEASELVKDIEETFGVSAAAPVAATREAVDPAVVEHEKAIYMAQAAESGKPEAIQEKIALGRMDKFYKENCLLDQEFVKDNKINIKQYTQNTAKELGGSIEIKKFVRFEKGEGIEKRQDDFAAEVASMVK